MVVATSKLTSQGQISIPAEVRRRLGIRPGAQLVWEENKQGEIVVRPKRYTLDDLHKIMGNPKVHLTLQELREARGECWDERARQVAEIKR